ncbi:MAG: hypothetical protein JWN17_1076, partial [Frankiales bacterium]|nr:hypothetical protein [Frankiales bacterium]
MSTRDLGQGPVVPWDATDLLPGLTRLTASSRAASTRAAEDAVLLADLAARVPRAPGDERGGTAWTSFLREVAVARRCSDRAAAADVAQAVQLVRMPVTLGLLRSGDLPVPQMRALVEETWTAGASTLARIDAEVGSRATRLSPSRVRDAARKVLLREEAEAVAVRAAKAAADRQVRRRPLADDQAEIVLVGPAVPVAQAYDALDAEARALRAAGDGRTLDALRFDLALHRLSGASLVAGARPSVGDTVATETSAGDSADAPADSGSPSAPPPSASGSPSAPAPSASGSPSAPAPSASGSASAPPPPASGSP